VLAASEYWMDDFAAPGQELAVATDPKINKLSDEFGQYTLVLQCSGCGHERHAQPHALARLCGWDTSIDHVVRRLRCSKCGKNNVLGAPICRLSREVIRPCPVSK
jgi:ribosomal protein L44E